MASLTWRTPPDDLAAEADRVDLWRVALDRPTGPIDALSATLDADERRRAARFAIERDRRRFVVARGALRTVLGRYLETSPAAVRLGYGQYGKPQLDRGDATPALTFNVSHAGDRALIAVTGGRAVGVDLEEIRPDFATMDVARRFFAPAEVAALWSLPPDQQVVGFFNCWTRKEAYVKARGEGLSAPLDRFVVSVAPGEPAALLRSDIDPREVARWSLRALDLGSDYVGALAVEGSDWGLACWDAAPENLSPRLSPTRGEELGTRDRCPVSGSSSLDGAGPGTAPR